MKDPAFLFYPGDWLGGTLGMTFEEKGAYMELLMMQFNRGHMEAHMIGQVVGQLWVKLQDKFVQDDKGLWYNERLDLEKEKRKAFTKSRLNNLSGTNQYTKGQGHTGGHTTNRMEDEDENINKDIGLNGVNVLPGNGEVTNKKPRGKFIKPAPKEITEYAKSINFELDGEYFFDKYEGNGWVVGKANTKMKDWKAVVRTWKKNNFNSNNGKTEIASEAYKPSSLMENLLNGNKEAIISDASRRTTNS